MDLSICIQCSFFRISGIDSVGCIFNGLLDLAIFQMLNPCGWQPLGANRGWSRGMGGKTTEAHTAPKDLRNDLTWLRYAAS